MRLLSALLMAGALTVNLSQALAEDEQRCEASTRLIKVNECELQAFAPDTWCLQAEFDRFEARPTAHPRDTWINIGWYNPPRARSFLRFNSWIAESARGARRFGHDVRVKRFAIGPLDAAEIRSINSRGRLEVETFIGVPYSADIGEMFEIYYQSPNTKQGWRDYVAYQKLVQGIKASCPPGTPSPPN